MSKKMINENGIYTDKTKSIYDLTKEGLYYFLSSPRILEKTLLCSTLEDLFKGNRKLFKSLYIDTTNFPWTEHPVLSINFTTMTVTSAEALRKALNEELNGIAEQYKVTLGRQATLGGKLKSLITELAKKNRVVILIDEYDAPILNYIDNVEEAEEYQDVLAEFFSALKDGHVDEHLRYVLITGVSDFFETALFLDLTNLVDLSNDIQAQSLLKSIS